MGSGRELGQINRDSDACKHFGSVVPVGGGIYLYRQGKPAIRDPWGLTSGLILWVLHALIALGIALLGSPKAQCAQGHTVSEVTPTPSCQRTATEETSLWPPGGRGVWDRLWGGWKRPGGR